MGKSEDHIPEPGRTDGRFRVTLLLLSFGQAGIPLILMIVFSFFLSGCFEEDQVVTPHVPGDELSYEFRESMYTHQAFYDLGTNAIVTENINGEWLIRFAALEADHHISINSADYWGVYDSGTGIADSIPESIPSEKWIFDSSSGNPDSTAFTGWVKITGDDTLYTGNIYLIGQYDGISYRARWAAQFTHFDAGSYAFRIRPWPEGEWSDYVVEKSEEKNYIYYSADGTFPEIEPGKNSWDLLFTQYGSILYTDDGIPTPYYVRGVLLNSYNLTVAIDSVNSFGGIGFENLSAYNYSSTQDVIGYKWKKVEVDVISNTAVYTVRPDITYIVRDTEGFYYKMRFISFYNDMGEKGFPVIEQVKL